MGHRGWEGGGRGGGGKFFRAHQDKTRQTRTVGTRDSQVQAWPEGVSLEAATPACEWKQRLSGIASKPGCGRAQAFQTGKNPATPAIPRWEPVDHLQGSLGPPKPRKKSENVLLGLWGFRLGPPREPEKSLESLERSRRSRQDFFQTLGGVRGQRLRRESFFRFSGVSGPEGLRDPCK